MNINPYIAHSDIVAAKHSECDIVGGNGGSEVITIEVSP
jgi:hypothetical protein